MTATTALTAPAPLVLDLDGSVQGIDGVAGMGPALRVPLGAWQEAMRFGCGWRCWAAFCAHAEALLDALVPAAHGTVLLGSGDFHHLSHWLLQRVPGSAPFDVVVLDNHPDNMRFPWGIHCGSWVHHAARLPRVRRIDVLGIGSGDVGWRHAWENHLLPLARGKVRYWSVGVDLRWTRALGPGAACRSFATPAQLLDAFCMELHAGDAPVYLSIDKDVFSPTVAHTNWDQGCFDLPAALRVIAALRGRIVGSDITGEVSIHPYRTRWKRWLSALDAQPAISAAQLQTWQEEQAQVNQSLLAALAQSRISY
ncbi:hypothetical protein [Extensimonas sp. H3M7-6]|uniref:hypothetical protein n=1 Tax=Extensimonas soli TaxID=3031322 RepID=UPI0023DCD0E4|nr:hypothetical protein [Extensimonas sp. H3M7-6]MDF1481673.1 hypothetical protein [Extensimonas sp. H3M7-6]